jgi:hypothetical protein
MEKLTYHLTVSCDGRETLILSGDTDSSIVTAQDLNTGERSELGPRTSDAILSGLNKTIGIFVVGALTGA